MKTLVILLLTGLSLIPTTFCFSQTGPEPRTDDHFMRQRYVIRIDLPEKINEPLQKMTDPSIYEQGQFEFNNGIVQALLAGIRTGEIKGLNPDDLSTPVFWEDICQVKIKNEPKVDTDFGPEEDPDFDPELDYEPVDPDNDVFPGTVERQYTVSDFAELETSIEIIEDRIYDKARSDLFYQIRYIRLVFSDPSEVLPDEYVVCIPYDQNTKNLLEKTRWPNRFNDAEDRSALEILDLRLFNEYIVNVSGNGVKSLEEAAFRQQQMIEYEHNLYQY